MSFIGFSIHFYSYFYLYLFLRPTQRLMWRLCPYRDRQSLYKYIYLWWLRLWWLAPPKTDRKPSPLNAVQFWYFLLKRRSPPPKPNSWLCPPTGPPTSLAHQPAYSTSHDPATEPSVRPASHGACSLHQIHSSNQLITAHAICSRLHYTPIYIRPPTGTYRVAQKPRPSYLIILCK